MAPDSPPLAEPPPDLSGISFEFSCLHCGHSLKGIRLNEHCPDCNKPVGDTLDLGAIDLATATVSADALCPQCGYNLRTLSIDGVCPECGRAIANALHRNMLGLANPAWRKRVLSGIHRLLFVMIAAPLTLITMISVAIGVPTVSSTALTLAGIGIGIVLFAALVMGLFGVSARDRQGADQRESAWPRIITRITILLAGFLIVAAVVAIELAATIVPQGMPYTAIDIAVFLAVILGLVSVITIGLCFRQIARRARKAPLVTGTNAWVIIFTVTASVGTLTPITVWLTGRVLHTPRAFGELGVAILGIVAVVAFVLSVQAFLGLFAYRRLLRGVVETGSTQPEE